MSQQSVMVTGGAGYIGSSMVRSLLAKGYRVVVVDDLSRGHAAALDPRAVFYQLSVGDREAIKRVLREHAVDQVMHFAAFIEVGESVEEPELYYQNNVGATLGLLAAMREVGVQSLVFSSTAAVYGNPQYTPIDEKHPRLPVNPYGHAKNMVELILADYAAAYGLSYTSLRYFNVAGAATDGHHGECHQPESHLIPRILSAAAGQTPRVPIYGLDYATADGTCIRDFVHIDDLVEAHLLALGQMTHKPGAYIYNLGSEQGYSVRQVIDACSKVTGKPIQVEERPRRPGDPPVLVASSQKIRAELGWQPRYSDLLTVIGHAWHWHQRFPHGYPKQPQF